MPDKTWDIIPNRMSENISGGIIKNPANKKSINKWNGIPNGDAR